MTVNTGAMTRTIDFSSLQRTIEVGPHKLAYWRTGSGPDLVFIHGWPLHSATYRNIIPILATQFTCHCIDVPGCGKSPYIPETRYDLMTITQTLAKAIDTLNLPSYGLVGHDSGGAMARFIAAQAPDKVFGLALGNSEIPHHHSPIIRLLTLMTKIPGGYRLFTQLMKINALRRSTLGFGSCFYDLNKMEGEFSSLFVPPFLDSASGGGLRHMLEDFELSTLDQLEGAHAKISAPTLLVWGKHDPYFPVKHVNTMRKQFAGPTEMHVIEQGKLFVHEEHPEQFAAYCAEFFQACLPAETRLKTAV